MNQSPEQPASDDVVRHRIRHDLDENFLVEAAAGTGKTTSIVDRMVNLIATGTCPIERMAAVTFTRKAAAELRERFQAALRRRAATLRSQGDPEDQKTAACLLSASESVGRAFVGTIHSFCATLLRERPIEFGVDPAFRELDEDEDQQLRDRAWHENISDLFASGDPLIDRIDEMGLDRVDLRDCFDRFIEYRDVDQWPCETPADFDVETARAQTHSFLEEARQLAPMFPIERGNDELMSHYEAMLRLSDKGLKREGNFFDLLDKMDRSRKVVQKQWHDKTVAKSEKAKFDQFRQSVIRPALVWWCRKRYEFVVRFVRRAVTVYERDKSIGSGLDFADLLLIAARGLKTQPNLRRYFQQRYSHLLVDEFQDTDPVQAQTFLYLCSEDADEQTWHACRPKKGSLFLVGDPKQSIYRFRRGDIVTYNRVKEVFARSGTVLALTKNFRSRDELRTWNNRVYQTKFGSDANQYAPAAEDMMQGRVDAVDGELAGIRKLSLPPDSTLADATQLEAETIATFIRNAIENELTVPRSDRESEIGVLPEVRPCDFLIIPRGKKRIHFYKEALDRHGIPCQVTGGNALTSIPQLQVLLDCLKAIDDPLHPIHYLSVLRDRLFGFTDADLYEVKKAGGRFSFPSEVPDDLDPAIASRLTSVNERMFRYQRWLRLYPFSTAVRRVAADLGLLASAAVTSERNISLGGFLKAIDLLRQHESNFDSAADLITYLESLSQREETEGCEALSPNTNVVRVMNLHKAKGLEAPIVFLADTAAPFGGLPICHVDRQGDTAVGYMGITKKHGRYHTREVATPANWNDRQREEQRFLEAERDRLLYVATTRAASMMIVSVGKEKSNWSALHRFLSDAPELTVPPQSKAVQAGATTTTAATKAGEIATRWDVAMTPSYAIESAKESALKGIKRPDWQASGDFGYKWGSAVHELLEIASKSPSISLTAPASRLVMRYDLGNERAEELLETTNAVIRSDIWRRATESPRKFSELPFETRSDDGNGLPLITRGVIDLIFEEFGQWVIVDYKTDDIAEKDVPSAVEYYRSQLTEYAKQWRATTNEPVSEIGLYFTRIDHYKALSPEDSPGDTS